MDRSEYAAQLFVEGYNCAQAVVVAYCDLMGLDKETAARLSSSFGGGMGRLREVCGAVSGMFMVAGMLYGYSGNEDNNAKMAHYKLVQDLAAQFREENGSIVCREILKNPPSDPVPTPRTAEFYKTRPCTHMVVTACRILDNYIAQHPVA